MLIGRNAVEVWHVARIEKRGGDLFLEKIDTFKVSYVTTSLKIHAVKSYKQVHQNKTHATHLGISARLTAVALTQLGDVSTIIKTLVETLNDALQNLDATGSVDSSAVQAGRAQTLAKFFYDRNDQEEVLCLDGPGAHRFHVWMEKTDSMFGWTWRSWRISAKLLCPWSTAVPKEEASLALLPTAAVAADPTSAAPTCCVRRATNRA